MRSLRAQPASRQSCWIGLGALVAYLLVAFVYLGLPLLTGSGSRYLGVGNDPKIFIWSFAWWPHAILHGENPFYSHAVWSPDGFNATWATTVPGLALLFAPVTLLAGPVASYNLAGVLLPAVSAWAAFILCRQLTRRTWPSLIGGYGFGFSSYELAHVSGGQLHLVAVAPLPLVALIVLRFLDGSLTGRQVVVRLGPLLAFELLVSTEVTVTIALSAGVALVLGYLLVPSRRKPIVAVLPSLVASTALAAVLTTPFLYYLLTGFRSERYFKPDDFTADLLNFVVPSNRALVGGGSAADLARDLPSYVFQPEAYLGLPLVAIACLYAWERRRSGSGRFLVACLAVATIAAMGAHATVAGHRIVDFPWALVHSLPVFDNILTVRFALFMSLLLAVVTASWAASRRSGVLRWALPVLAVIAIVPAPHSGWTSTYSVPAFFTDAAYRKCLDPGERVLPLPIGQGDAMLWQAASDFRFDLAGGYVGPKIPVSFLAPGHMFEVTGGNHLGPAQTADVRYFVATKHVTSAVVAGYEADFFTGALNGLATGQDVGGIVLYHFTKNPPACQGP